MANIIIPLSANFICQSICESYNRLTGSYSGPLVANATANSGFLIQNGNKQSGLFVGNSCIVFGNNFLNFNISNSDTCLNLSNGRNFIITGNGSRLIFDTEGTLAVGSGIDTNYKGIQINSTQASLTLKNTNNTQTQAIRYLQTNGTQSSYLCKNSSLSFDIYSCDIIKLCSYNPVVGSGFLISGEYFGINSNINNNFNFSLSGSSFFSNYSYHSGCVNFSGINCFGHPNNLETGLRVNTISNFQRSGIFNDDIVISGVRKNLLISNGCISANTGYFNYLSGNSSSAICLNSGFFSNLCVFFEANKCVEIDTCAKFKRSADFSSINSNSYISGCVISGTNIQTSGYITASRLLISNTNQTFDHSISGRCITLAATGQFQCSLFVNSNCSFFNGPIETVGQLRSSSFLSTGRELNTINGSICSSGALFVESGARFGGSSWITGGSACFTTQVCSPIVTTTCVNQIFTNNVTNCFGNNINVGGILCCGIVNSLNTAKAWGVFSLKAGIPTLLTGYNVARISIPATGILSPLVIGQTTFSPQTITHPYMMYGIVLENPLTYPFSLIGSFSPVNQFNFNCIFATPNTYQQTYSFYTSLPSTIHLINCGGTNVNGGSSPSHFTALNPRSSFYEPLVNITSTCGYTVHSVNSLTMCGTGSFVIFSSKL